MAFLIVSWLERLRPSCVSSIYRNCENTLLVLLMKTKIRESIIEPDGTQIALNWFCQLLGMPRICVLVYERLTQRCFNCFREGDFGEERDDGDVHKRKCARLKRENDMLRQQLRQQHEDDLEQLVGLKKQLEKRVII